MKLLKRIVISILLLSIVFTNSGCTGNGKKIDKTTDKTLLKDEVDLKNNDEKRASDDIKNQDEDSKELEKGSGKTPISIIFYGTKPEEFDEVARLAEKKSGLNIQLDFKWYKDMDYIKEMKTALTDSKVVGFSTEFMAHKFKELFKSNKIKNVKESIEKYAPDLRKSIERLHIPENYKYKDYIMPQLQTDPYKILVNLDEKYIDKYKMAEVRTIEDYIDIIARIRLDNDEDGVSMYPNILVSIVCNAYDYVLFDSMYNLVYKKDDKAMKLYPIEQLPEFKELALSFSNAYKEGIFTIEDKEDGYSELKVSHSINEKIRLLQYGDNIKDSNDNKDDIVLKHTYALYIGKAMQNRDVINSSFVFLEDAKHVKETIQFINWVHSGQESYDLINYGIEGKHYTLENDNIKIIKEFDICENLFKNNQYERRESILQQYDHRNIEDEPMSYYPAHLGFESKLPQYTRWKDLNDTLYKAIKNGELTKEKYTEIVEKLEPGANGLIPKMQKELDDFNKKNQ